MSSVSAEDVASRISADHGRAYATQSDVEATYVFSDSEILDIANRVFDFCLMASGVDLYPYQMLFGLRIVQSLLLEDGEEITALFARQSGKTETVAVVVVGCMAILPALARVPDLAIDPRISKFKDGLWVGIFAPTHEQGGIMHSRMAVRAGTERFRDICADPDISTVLGEGRSLLHFSNGSYVDCNSASPQARIEGKTYHLILCEETQDILNRQLRKSIHPMAAATSGTIVKIGTPNRERNDFYEACVRGAVRESSGENVRLQTHFEFDFTIAQKYNPRYRKYITREIERLGYDSEEFRQAYRLHWLVESAMFATPEMLREAGIRERDTLKAINPKDPRSLFFFSRPAAVVNSDRVTEGLVASLDIGRRADSTVATIARVWWDNPVIGQYDTPRYRTHILNWLELQGDDHEVQFPKLLSFFENYRLSAVVVDATGRGDPIYDRLSHKLNPDGKSGIEVVPFVFTLQSKHDAYVTFTDELKAGRFTFPDGDGTRKLDKQRRFKKQMSEAVKVWKGKYLTVEAPRQRTGRGEETARDDYPDSAAMLCWFVNRRGIYRFDTAENPLFRMASRNIAMRNVRGADKWSRK